VRGASLLSSIKFLFLCIILIIYKNIMTRHKLKRRNKTHKQKIKRGKSRKVKQSRKLKQSRKCKHNKKYNKTRKLKQIHNEKIDEYKLVLNAIYKMQKLKSNKKIKNKKFVGGGAIKQIFVKIPQLFPNFSETPEQLAKVIISSTKCGLKDKFKGKTFNEVYNCVKEEYKKLGQAAGAATAATAATATAAATGVVVPGGPDVAGLANNFAGPGGIVPGAGGPGPGVAGLANNFAGPGGIVPGAGGPGPGVAGTIPGVAGAVSNSTVAGGFASKIGANNFAGAGLANAGANGAGDFAGLANNFAAPGAGPQK
jgi:hypothetical protein